MPPETQTMPSYASLRRAGAAQACACSPPRVYGLGRWERCWAVFFILGVGLLAVTMNVCLGLFAQFVSEWINYKKT